MKRLLTQFYTIVELYVYFFVISNKLIKVQVPKNILKQCTNTSRNGLCAVEWTVFIMRLGSKYP